MRTILSAHALGGLVLLLAAALRGGTWDVEFTNVYPGGERQTAVDRVPCRT
jgi:hypothetical protein